MKAIFWFRNDLRLHDNPGLMAAIEVGQVLPIFILDPRFNLGSVSRCWLHHSLDSLNNSLHHVLNLYKGDSEEVICSLIAKFEITHVFWNRVYEPDQIKRDASLKSLLKSKGVICKSYNASLLVEPWDNLKQDDTPYKVFTPFCRTLLSKSRNFRLPLATPSGIKYIKDGEARILDELELLPKHDWHHKLMKNWQVGEVAAHQALKNFLEDGLSGYAQARDYPSLNAVSKLSPRLHFGEISPIQIWQAIDHQSLQTGKTYPKFITELCWREFSYYLLYHYPDLPTHNFNKKFDRFTWHNNSKYLRAWQKGKTGFPIIDAGMRELWETGFMHNRVRMIVASFLVKNLLVDWRVGASWFWDCLVDADLASNSASWQWVAGSGADAAPYFRIFNPVLQGEKFDAQGDYVKKYVPELYKLPAQYIHKPWLAPDHVLDLANVTLGKNYPLPIVDLAETRNQALAIYRNL